MLNLNAKLDPSTVFNIDVTELSPKAQSILKMLVAEVPNSEEKDHKKLHRYLKDLILLVPSPFLSAIDNALIAIEREQGDFKSSPLDWESVACRYLYCLLSNAHLLSSYRGERVDETALYIEYFVDDDKDPWGVLILQTADQIKSNLNVAKKLQFLLKHHIPVLLSLPKSERSKLKSGDGLKKLGVAILDRTIL